MIKNLGALEHTKSLLNSLKNQNTSLFNSTLPISLKVLVQKDLTSYLIQLGSREIETKSKAPLQTGKEYWANLSENKKQGIVKITNLLQKPDFLQNIKGKITLEQVIDLLANDNKLLSYKETMYKGLLDSSSRNEFMFFQNSLLSLNNGIFSFPIMYEDKEFFLQLKEEVEEDENEQKEKQLIKFYASFSNLGPIGGELYLIDESVTLHLQVHYENSYKFLQNYINELGFNAKISLGKPEPISIIEESILDIKG